MALPFGKTIKTRHFTVLKFSKSLSKKEVAHSERIFLLRSRSIYREARCLSSRLRTLPAHGELSTLSVLQCMLQSMSVFLLL